jgi:hypothetical protein
MGLASDLYGWRTPAEAGCITTSTCVVVDDPDAHRARAVAAGAEIIRRRYANEGYSGSAQGARDSEANVRSFGSYDPFAAG